MSLCVPLLKSVAIFISDCADPTNCNTCTDANAGSCTACNTGYWLDSGACSGSYPFHRVEMFLQGGQIFKCIDFVAYSLIKYEI